MHSATLLITAWLAVAAPPPLTDAQRAQLDTAADHRPLLDEAAWYPLIENALQGSAGDDAAAARPDAEALLEDPQAARGELFLIEGQLARARPIRLTRPGPWGQTLTEWTIVVDRRDPQDLADDRVAVVYLVDPDEAWIATPQRSAVRIAARFYKVWRDRDATGAASDYLTFVGAHPTLLREGPVRVGRSEVAATAPWWLLIPVLVLLLAALALVRQLAPPRKRRVGRQTRGVVDSAPQEEAATPDLPPDAPPDLPPDLPADAAAALEELQRRRA